MAGRVAAPAAGSVASTAQPTRRRDAGTGSARSLLLTVLGEFVHPRGRPVWTATLVAAMAALGVEEKAARQAVARTAAEGLLTSARDGRRVQWLLTAHGEALLTEGTERIHGFLHRDAPWDGRWLVLTVPVPESQRRLRHRLRTRLTWLGLGSPASGLWVSPDASKADEVRAVVQDLGLEQQSFAWVGAGADIGDEQRLLTAAWDLDGVEERYRQFLHRFAGRRVEPGPATYAAQVELVQEWRRFPFLDPGLPRELLDHDWAGLRAATVFHDLHARWHRGAQAVWEQLEQAGDPA